MSNTMHDYILSCGHSYSQFRLLTAGERPYCDYCGAFRRVSFLIGEVRFHCESCGYTRRCGFARLAAESAAAAHATRKQHTVSLQRMELWGPEALHTFDHNGESDIQLPF